MINRKLIFAGVVVGIASLSGCSREDEGAESAVSMQQAQGKEVGKDLPVAVDSSVIEFTVDPSALSACSNAEPMTARVNWVVRDLAVTEVRVEVSDSPAGARKLLSVGGRQGQVVTDAWVRAGTTFSLADSKAEKQLAVVEVQGIPCQ